MMSNHFQTLIDFCAHPRPAIFFFALMLSSPHGVRAKSSHDQTPAVEWSESTAEKEAWDQSPLRMLVWNLYKGSRRDFPQDFYHFQYETDIALIQEHLMTDPMRSIFNLWQGFQWTMVSAWHNTQGEGTGVGIFSRFQPLASHAVLTRDFEFEIFTPKSSLIQLYAIQFQKEPLLVVSTHSLNFVRNAPFRRQLEAIAEIIQDHRGPLIWGGDFNTWSSRRLQILLEIQAKLETSQVNWPTDPRSLKLDHVFYRGLRVKRSEILTEIRSSDHWPLSVEFELID